MSSSDYISLRRMRNMHQLSCNTIPNCHQLHGGEMTLHTPSTHTHPHSHNNTNYCVVPAKCVNNNGRVVSTDLVYCPDDDCEMKQKYITQTIKAYRVSPQKNATVGVLVEKNLPFTPGQSISCSILDSESNYFNGVIFDYDKDTGFLSVGAIDNVTGDFSNSVVYNINLILFDPEVVKLKQRMDYLYKYLFQVELDTSPTYNPVTEQVIFFDTKVYNLLIYLFNYNIRINNDYVLSEQYLLKEVRDIYKYFFDVDMLEQPTFNPNRFVGVAMNTLKHQIYQIYIYLFSVNLEQSPWFNPNTTNN